MKKPLFKLFLLLFAAGTAVAAPRPKPALKPVAVDSAALYRAYADSVNGTFHYQQGHITLPGAVGELTVPRGFRYLDSTQSGYVLHKLWHNPPQENLGMLFPENVGPLSEANWAYIVHYDPMGYVKDDDADDINYEELMEGMQKETEEENPERTAAGYEAMHLLGWGAKPYYDKQQHTLHWAKLLRFGSSLDETLNYNVRILGRKGVLIFNAVGEPTLLPQMKASIPGLLANVTFTKGQQYSDYSPDIDEVAAYSIGGLVAGKVLAKVGFFAIILKFWKLGLLALGGAWAAIKRFFGFGAKES
ncbi:DUF2167 domain-containing protein [Hymenobacter ginkgonis]|nr:DUF2167 domain-containing protein [Hymenobacter ginkgonis]